MIVNFKVSHTGLDICVVADFLYISYDSVESNLKSLFAVTFWLSKKYVALSKEVFSELLCAYPNLSTLTLPYLMKPDLTKPNLT